MYGFNQTKSTCNEKMYKKLFQKDVIDNEKV